MKVITLLIIVLSGIFTCDVNAEPEKRAYSLSVEEKKVSLQSLLRTVGKNTKKKFLVHADTRAELVINGVDIDGLSFSDLLLIIDLNQMASVEIEGVINVVPVNRIKQYPIPTIKNDSLPMHGSLWVSKVISAGNSSAGHLVPILRSLVRLNGHLANHAESNSIIIVAPYNTVLRVEELVNQLSEATDIRNLKKRS